MKLVHQILLIMETACRIDEQDIGIPCLCRRDGVVDHRSRIRSVLSPDHLDARAVRPLRELLICRSPVSIRRGQDDFLSPVLVNAGQFSHGRRLARAVHTDNKNRGFLLFKRVIRIVRMHALTDDPDQHVAALHRLPDMVGFHAVAQLIEDFLRRPDSDIPFDHDLLEIIVEIIIDPVVPLHHVVDPAYENLLRLVQPADKSLKKFECHVRVPLYSF